ncbi:MAG: hypothetical protein AAGI17_07010 [Planctomycetota bacterium]
MAVCITHDSFGRIGSKTGQFIRYRLASRFGYSPAAVTGWFPRSITPFVVTEDGEVYTLRESTRDELRQLKSRTNATSGTLRFVYDKGDTGLYAVTRSFEKGTFWVGDVDAATRLAIIEEGKDFVRDFTAPDSALLSRKNINGRMKEFRFAEEIIRGEIDVTHPIYSGYAINALALTSLITMLISAPSLPGFAVRTARRFRRPAWACRGCGYDLRGTPENAPCPECGAERSPGAASR